MKHLNVVLQLGGLALCFVAALAQRPTIALIGWFLTVCGVGRGSYQYGRVIGWEEADGYYRQKEESRE